MYEKLIASLRYCSETNSLSLYKRELMKAAADAIEDLSKMLDEETEINTALECNMPVWIPVAERLPEDGEYYLAYVTDGRRKMVRGLKFQKISRSWYLTGKQSYWKVTHWMPLPEPPKYGEA